jgi:hypothetical protein
MLTLRMRAPETYPPAPAANQTVKGARPTEIRCWPVLGPETWIRGAVPTSSE